MNDLSSEYAELVRVSDKAQTIIMAISPDPVKSVGIVAMMLTNFLASGTVCGLFGEEFCDELIGAIREGVRDSIDSISKGLAEEAEGQTIQ